MSILIDFQLDQTAAEELDRWLDYEIEIECQGHLFRGKPCRNPAEFAGRATCSNGCNYKMQYKCQFSVDKINEGVTICIPCRKRGREEAYARFVYIERVK